MKTQVKPYYLFLSLMNFFTLSTADSSSFDIIIELINRTSFDDNYISLEELSNNSHVSQATISRFVRILGFDNYNDFNLNFYKALAVSQQVRNNEYMNCGLEELINERYNHALNNIVSTKNSLDIDILTQIIKEIKEAKNTIFFGTPENISHFTRFKSDLIVNHCPCFFFYDGYSQAELLKLNLDRSVAIFVVLSNDHLVLYHERIQKLKTQNTTLILFTQDNTDEQKANFDYVYVYGESNSYRLGDYSIEFLATVLSCIFVKSL